MKSDKENDKLFCSKRKINSLVYLPSESKVYEIENSLKEIDRILSLVSSKLNYTFDDEKYITKYIDSQLRIINNFELGKSFHFTITNTNLSNSKAHKISLKELYKILLNDVGIDNIDEFSTEDLIRYLQAKKIKNPSTELQMASDILGLIPTVPVNVALAAISFLS